MTEVPPSDILTRRVCLQLDGSDTLIVQRNVPFGEPGGPRRMDLYYPPEGAGHSPAVIIVSGYPGNPGSHPATLSYKEIGWTVSMCQLIALSGIVAIAYTNTDPVADLQTLLEYVHESAGPLRIDATRIGILAVSGNVPTALATITRHASRTPVCAVLGYGCFLDLDGATDVADAARQFGFANPGAGRSMADLRRDVPLLITRAGRDAFPAMNASIDRFIRHALVENLPITFVNHAEGPHAFDLFDDSRTSRDILRLTLRFLRQHLTVESPDRGP